ncbi:MAG: hypothetical protein V2I57_05465 [Xanthomonadales bacterium]|nr:hypothetical protein [Xanthomonadales bacterium]
MSRGKTFTRRTVKFLHTFTGLGLVGGLAAYMLVLWAGPPVTSLSEYAAMRTSLAAVSKWLIMPSMLGVIVSGLIAMALNFSYMEAPWAWLKLLSGVLVFEGSLGGIDGPAQATALLASQALAGEAEAAATIAAGVKNEWIAFWTLLFLSAANIALATWRPKFRRRRQPEPAGGGGSFWVETPEDNAQTGTSGENTGNREKTLAG